MMLELKPKGLKPPKKERKKSRETNIPPAHGHKHATTTVADRVQPPAEEDGTSWPGGARPGTRVTLSIGEAIEMSLKIRTLREREQT